MRIVFFYHSLLSDWNHGNAHFLRGVVRELTEAGHDVIVYEPADGWSISNLIAEQGERPLKRFRETYPGMEPVRYREETLVPDEALDGADLVLVHEWNSAGVVGRIGRHHLLNGGYVLLFHDTHHRSVSDRDAIAAFDLGGYDGVLAFGESIRQRYIAEGWSGNVWTWHEAADTRIFYPRPGHDRMGDVVWIGNWGDGERSAELREFLLGPVSTLRLGGRVYGVRYPEYALRELLDAGMEYGGWLPNFRVPEVFPQYGCTVHIPRRPYREALPGIPTIRVFEALACGIPLVSAPWADTEALFSPGRDFLTAGNGEEMKECLRAVLNDRRLARELASHGLRTIRARHTCGHRVRQLLSIYEDIKGGRTADVLPGTMKATN